jgi:hypothetical protein
MIVPASTPDGTIRYLVLRSIFAVSPDYEVRVFLPYGKESQQYYQQYHTAAADRVYIHLF